MGQVPSELSSPLLLGHPKTPILSKWQWWVREHSSASRAAGADETPCQGSSSAAGDGEGQPAKALAPLQAQPRAQLHAARGQHSHPGTHFPPCCLVTET